MKRWILIVAVLAAALATATVLWRRAATERRVEETLAAVGSLLDKNRAAEANVLLQATKPPAADSPRRAAWSDLEVRTALATRQFELLRRLGEREPDAVARNPEAAMWLERIAVLGGGEAENPGPILAADKALRDGDVAAARQILESAKLEGNDEINRLARLALLDAGDPAKAWKLLSQAYAIDPRNSDVRTFSANLLEQSGNAALARRDYVAALVANPDNLRARDNLAEFYMRQRMLPQAVQTWLDTPAVDGSAIFYLKAWFWNRVGLGSLPPPDPAACGRLVAALAALPAGDFWGAGPDKIVAASRNLGERREIVWLRALQELKDGREDQVQRLLARAVPENAPDAAGIRAALEFLLAVRLGSTTSRTLEISPAQIESHPFWKWLAEHRGDANALRQPWVIPTLFCVGGWLRAGTNLARPQDLADAPEWSAYALARAAQLCGDGQRFGEFLAASPERTPAMQILRAEFDIAAGRPEAARPILESLLGKPGAGYRAAFLLAMDALGRGDGDAAKRAIERQPDFAESVAGRELLARAALARGDEKEAVAIYEKLGDSSDDARIYLARVAFEARDWKRAEALTLSLAADHPNEPAFADNLEKIREAANGP